MSLTRTVKLVGKEDNTQCISFVKRGYSPALRYLKRHFNLSLGFVNEIFFPDQDDPDAPQYDADLVYWPTEEHKGDWMTKELSQSAFQAARLRCGYR